MPLHDRTLKTFAGTSNIARLSPPTLLTTKEAAKYLRVCSKTMLKLVKQKKLPAAKIGRRFRITKQSLDAYLNNSTS